MKRGLDNAVVGLHKYKAELYDSLVEYIKQHRRAKNVYHLPQQPSPGDIVYVENEDSLFISTPVGYVEL